MTIPARWAAACVLLAALALPDLARGQPSAGKSVLVAPRPVDTPSVPYPEGASGSAAVVLDLTVDVTGRVTDATVVEGGPPFAPVARQSALRWRYEPARRGDRLVSARIRVIVDFHPAPPESPDPSDVEKVPAGSTATPASPQARTQVEEVRVRGERAEVARTSLGNADVRQMPGAFGDAFRAIDALPGVTPIVSGLPYYFIRGAPPGNTGYMIDGVRVPLLFHFGVARAVVHPALIDHVDFYAGGYPVKYGRFTGGIIDGITKAPLDRFHGEWDVSILHAGAFVETPFADGRGTVAVGGRYGYPGLLLSLLAPEVFLQYGDYQTRASWRATPRDTVSVFAFGSVDVAGSRDKQGELKNVTSTQFHRVDTRWDRDLGSLGTVRTAVTVGFDQTAADREFSVRDLVTGVRTQWTASASEHVRVRAGSDLWFDSYSLSSKDRDTVASFPTRDDIAAGLYADAIVDLGHGVEVVPGLRFDFFESKSSASAKDSSTQSVDPRVATRVRLSPRVTWMTAFGLTHQPPSFLVPVPGLQLGNLDRGVQTAVQASQGVEVTLPLDFTFAPTVFVHNYLDLTDATATCRFGDFDPGNACIDQRVRGRTVGLEVLLRRPLTKRLTGWVSYTLSRSTRDVGKSATDDVLQRVQIAGLPRPAQQQRIPSDFDRAHVLNVVAAYDLGRNWRLGGRTVFYTGRPYSNRFHGIPVPPYNSERLPDFFRIDFRLEKRWPRKDGYIAFVAEALNATANREVLDVKCTISSNTSLDRCEPDTSGSIPVIVPTLGVEGAF